MCAKFLDKKGEHDTDDPAAPRPTSNKMQPGSRPDQSKHDPKVVKLADQLKVDLADVSGTGRDGAITQADVQKAADAKAKDAEAKKNLTQAPQQS